MTYSELSGTLTDEDATKGTRRRLRRRPEGREMEKRGGDKEKLLYLPCRRRWVQEREQMG